MTEEKIIERVKKLLALGQSPNPHEAAAAMEKAQALMAEHNLSVGKLRVSEINELNVRSQASVSILKPWEQGLMNTVAKAFGCRLFWKKGSSYGSTADEIYGWWTFVGPKHQLPICEWTAKVLSERLKKARTEFVRSDVCRSRSRSDITRLADGFCLGWAAEIAKKVHVFADSDYKEAMDEYVAKWSDMGQAKVDKKKVGVAGYVMGQIAAGDERLYRPMEGNTEEQGKISHG